MHILYAGLVDLDFLVKNQSAKDELLFGSLNKEIEKNARGKRAEKKQICMKMYC